jgi:hypothetical protein
VVLAVQAEGEDENDARGDEHGPCATEVSPFGRTPPAVPFAVHSRVALQTLCVRTLAPDARMSGGDARHRRYTHPFTHDAHNTHVHTHKHTHTRHTQFHTCSDLCNFLDYKEGKIIYKRYASLYFVAFVDSTDNELNVLEVIHHCRCWAVLSLSVCVYLCVCAHV